MTSITYRQLSPHEIVRVREIDRTEKIRKGYRIIDGKVIQMDVVWDRSPWREEGDFHSIPHFVHVLEEILKNDGIIHGAFDSDRLVALAAFQPHLTETMGQLALLHVSNGYRRYGIASHLIDEIVVLAKRSGATHLYVSATPSESAVGFYRSRGFVWTQTPHPALYALEPEDIHMIKVLEAQVS